MITYAANQIPREQIAQPMTYVQFNDSTNFPAVSVTRPVSFNLYSNSQPVTATETQVYQRYATFVYQLNPATIEGDVNVINSGVETRLDTLNAQVATRSRQDIQSTILDAILTSVNATKVVSVSGGSTLGKQLEQITLLQSLTANISNIYADLQLKANKTEIQPVSTIGTVDVVLIDPTKATAGNQLAQVSMLYGLTGQADQLIINTAFANSQLQALTSDSGNQLVELIHHSNLLEYLSGSHLNAVQNLTSINDSIAITNAVLDDFNSKSTAKLDVLTSVDFSTESTLMHVASTIEINHTLNNAQYVLTNSKLDSLTAVDYATQTTLEVVATRIQELSTNIFQVNTVNQPSGVATEANQELVKSKLDSLTGVDYATQATLLNTYQVITAILVDLQLKADKTEIQPVSTVNQLEVTVDNQGIALETKQNDIISALQVLSGNDSIQTDQLTSIATKIDISNAELDIINTVLETKFNSLTSVDYSTETTLQEVATRIQQLSTNIFQVNTVNQPSGVATESNQELIKSKLDVLTGIDYATAANQVTIITDILLGNTKLDVLTAIDYATQAVQYLTNAKLDVLTGVDYATAAIQYLTNSKLDALTSVNFATSDIQYLGNAKLDVLTGVNFATTTNQDLVKSKLDVLTGIDFGTAANQALANSKLDVLSSPVQTHDLPLTTDAGVQIGTQALTALPINAVAHQDFVRLLADEFGRVVTKAFNYSENADDVNVINIDQDRSIEPITVINALTGNNNGTTINVSQYAHHTFSFLVSFAALTAFPDRTVDLVVESSMTANAGEWSVEYNQRFTNDINKTVTLEGKSKYMRAATQNADGATVTAYYMGGN